jgi:hypothetical protein
MPSLRRLELLLSCAERAVDAEAMYGLTTLTTLRVIEDITEWVLDFSRLTTLTSLHDYSDAVTDEEVLALSHLTRLTDLNLYYCRQVTAEGLRALSSLTALTGLDLCPR